MDVGPVNSNAWDACQDQWAVVAARRAERAVDRPIERCEHEGDAASWSIGRPSGPDQHRPEAARIGDVPPVEGSQAPELRLVRDTAPAPTYGPGYASNGVPRVGSLIDVIA